MRQAWPRRALRACAAQALGMLAGAPLASPLHAGPREVELGIEELYYRTDTTLLNRENLLRLDRNEHLLRGTLSWRERAGPARGVFKGYVERAIGGTGDRTRLRARQAYVRYDFGEGASVRLGKQRIGWGSGFAWNPTNRIEPPKNPLNPGLEQEGTLAARMDLLPTAWAGVILVAARGKTQSGDLPFGTTGTTGEAAAVRVRFLVKQTDLALVFSGGDGRRTLVGLDVAREVGGQLSAHAEAALQRGSDLTDDGANEVFRIAAGTLWSPGDNAFAVEYFFNGEGLSTHGHAVYLARLEQAYGLATDPSRPAPARKQALIDYLAEAALPFSGGLGLRRHYLQSSWTRSRIRGEWTLAVRGVLGLSDGGTALTPGLSYSPRGDLTLSLDAVLLLGPERSEYRLAPFRGAVQARVRALF